MQVRVVFLWADYADDTYTVKSSGVSLSEMAASASPSSILFGGVRVLEGFVFIMFYMWAQEYL